MSFSGKTFVRALPILALLAYSDDALLLLDSLPAFLDGARLIRTANRDRKYWANDYIVATAARDLELFVAHDVGAPQPQWPDGYKPTGDSVEVKGRKLALFTRRLNQGEQIRIPGNVNQGQSAGAALNFILFARPADYSTASGQRL